MLIKHRVELLPMTVLLKVLVKSERALGPLHQRLFEGPPREVATAVATARKTARGLASTRRSPRASHTGSWTAWSTC